ncbi:MAG: hypothetical protein RMK99_07185 [Anaerolineales bacterium]|nr:hypothetical protein [Anaerolineales bacterium]
MDTIHAIYESQVKPLSVAERLELMRLIMEDLARSAPRWVMDISDIWAEEDLADLSRASLAYASAAVLEREDNAETR